MKRYHNGNWKRQSMSHQGNADLSFCESASEGECVSDDESLFSSASSRKAKSYDSKKESDEENNNLVQLLGSFRIPPHITAELITSGYRSIVSLLRMPYDIAFVYFEDKREDIWKSCVSYVQAFKIDHESLDFKEPGKFELLMDDCTWGRILRGGFRAHEFILVSGESGLGKSQLMITMALRAASEGLTVYHLDADDKIETECFTEPCRYLGYSNDILQNIKRIKTFSHGELLAAIRHIQTIIAKSSLGSRHLIIVDTLTGSLRRELPGPEKTCLRHNVLAKCVDAMKKMASDNDRDVIAAATTEVAFANRESSCNVNGLTSLGGCILQHSATTRIFLTFDDQDGSQQKVMTLQSSCRAPRRNVKYRISRVGFVLIDDDCVQSPRR